MSTDQAQNADLVSLSHDIRALTGQLGDFAKGFEADRRAGSGDGGFKPGVITGVALTACIGSFFFTMYIARTMSNDLRDMHAWQDVMRSKISVVEGKLNAPQQSERKP